MDWSLVESAVPLLFTGVLATIKICALAIVFGTVLGFALGMGASSHSRILRRVIFVYVDFIRGTPLLVQIFLVYFALPVVGLNFSEYWAGVLALSLNAGGFICEIVRGGIASIEKGQTEAAKSIGMRQGQILLQILFPQSWRAIIPPITNELITLIKGSALLSVISVYELTRAGQAIIAVKFAPFEIFLLIALYYYVLITGLAWLSRVVERRLPAW